MFAQGTDLGTIRGTVTDSTGALVPNAKVEITDLSTLVSREFTTDVHGAFQATALPSGRYKASVSATGFGTTLVNDIVLTGSDVANANAVLRAAASTNVEVTSEAATIDTTDQTLSQTLTSRAILELPRDSRDIYSFLYINPNITQSDAPGNFKFIGAQSYGASFSVDGQRSNGGIFGQATASQPSLEAVGDLNVLSNAFSAEYAGIANVRVTTKRGGSQFHGSIFYNNKNSSLSAWTLSDKSTLANFAPTIFQPTFKKPFVNITDVGASIGGPVKPLKNTWFFAAYEHDSTIQPTSVSSTTLPHPTLLAGNFSQMTATLRPAVGSTVLTPSELASNTITTVDSKGVATVRFNQIPQRLLNPVTAKLISLYYPTVGSSAPINPTTGTVAPRYTTSYPGRSFQDEGTLRLDHDFSDNNRLYGVYHGSAQNIGLNPVVGVFTGLGLSKTDRRNDTLSFSFTHVFSPHMVNEARGGFNKQHFYTHSNTTLRSFLQSIGFADPDITSLGSVIGASELDTKGHLAVTIGKFQAFSNGGRNTDRPADQNLATFGDTLNWTLGRHEVKIGGDFVRNQALDGFAVNRGNVRGLVTYSQSGSAALAAFLQGQAPSSVSFVNTPRPPMDVHNWESGYFVQDDFRINSKVTLNLGLRYDIITPFVDANDLMANLDPTFVNSTTGQHGRFVIPSTNTLKYLDPNIVNFGVVTADQSGLGIGRGLLQTDHSAFGPRVGIAWQVAPRTVLRGGYGIYYPTSAAQGIRDPLATNTFNQGRTKTGTGAWPTTGTSGVTPFSGGTLKGFGSTPSANYVPFDLKNPRVQQWNATVEREMPWQSSVRFSYIGGKETGQVVGRDLNMIAPSNNPFGTTIGDGVTPCDPLNNGDCDYSTADKARLKIPALGDFVTGFGNTGHSLTTSFQVQAQRQTRGLHFSVAYTFLDQKSSGLDVGNSSLGGDAYNPFQPDSDYGTDSFVSRHRIVAYAVADLPYGRGRRFGASSSRLTDAFIGGWQASTNLFWKTGTGFTPFYDCGDCDPVLPGNVASGTLDAVGDFNATSVRAVISGSPRSSVPSGFQWNPSAFKLPNVTGADLYTQAGVATRNAIYGPSMYGINLGVHKTFAITERIGFQLGADINNVLNHPMLSPDQNDGGGCEGCFANVGTFFMSVDQHAGTGGNQPKLLPVDTTDPSQYTPNPDFGRLYRSYQQEGITSNRQIRLRGRITF